LSACDEAASVVTVLLTTDTNALRLSGDSLLFLKVLDNIMKNN
jgi:hypothetical protein